jgi:carbohydrate kinase (thermoresistant glucokinase family)
MSGKFIIVMGVSASGKTTLGQALAGALHCPFYDADNFHSPQNIAKMHSGMALTDADRLPWLDALRSVAEKTLAAGNTAVLACSALRNAYRERLLPPDGTAAHVRFIYLHISRELARERARSRPGHYMPASLVESQFATLEEPPPDDPRVITLDAALPVESLVQATLAALR